MICRSEKPTQFDYFCYLVEYAQRGCNALGAQQTQGQMAARSVG